jgi:hypothetical protein
MIRRLFSTLREAASRDLHPHGVHFHQSESGRTYACHDTRCDPHALNPRGVIA